MANSLTEVRTILLPGFEGAALAIHEMGDAGAWPVLLLHGLFSSAEVNWIKYGHAACLAEAGEPCLLVDLDPQANATSGLGQRANGVSTHDLLDGVRHERPAVFDRGHALGDERVEVEISWPAPFRAQRA